MHVSRWLVGSYAVVSALALAGIPLSAAGWITPDPLSTIPAMLLGLPWSYVLLALGPSESFPVNFALLALAMAMNATVLWLLGRWISRRWRR